MINTISKQLAQQIVDTIHDVCGYHINFINTQGKIYASSNPDRIGNYHELGRRAALYGQTLEVDSDNEYKGTDEGINIPIYFHQKLIAVVGISGKPDEVRRYAHLAERISNILLHEQELTAENRTLDEKKLYLIRSLQNGDLDNPDYLNDCLTHFNIDEKKNYRMIYFKVNTRYNLVNISLLEQNIDKIFSPLKGSVYAYIYPNSFVGLIPDTIFNKNRSTFSKFAVDHRELIKIAIGKASSLPNSSESWQSAETAMNSIKDTDDPFIIFDDLTLEILLSGLNQQSIREYRNKVLSGLEHEDLEFLKIYYEENMSLQKTSERLFLHKNTVQQRLKRIQNHCGFDPRHFKDAVVLYLGINITL